MPRPGPRPYDCVRRSWHSDRHQPIRGSLIQEIFRAVNEIHSSPTKKNKEWQEKLPVVVLRAEEIMYSKADSEAEYTDLKTLWDRTNDAISTIIRRDDNIETGALLHPCIEAALNLGCTARKTPRSQRNIPRCYLSSATSPESSPVFYQRNILKPPPSSLILESDVVVADKPINRQPQNSRFVYFGETRNKQCQDPNLNLGGCHTTQKGVAQNHFQDLVDNMNPTGDDSLRNGCDLSLRLGILSVPEKEKEKEMSGLLMELNNDDVEMKLNDEEAIPRKRKADVVIMNPPLPEDRKLCRQIKFNSFMDDRMNQCRFP